MGVDHASMYGIYPMSDLEDMSEEELLDIDESDYSDNIEGWWELYDEDKHAGKCMTGYDREVHFNTM